MKGFSVQMIGNKDSKHLHKEENQNILEIELMIDVHSKDINQRLILSYFILNYYHY
jgi:hypothetical protein